MFSLIARGIEFLMMEYLPSPSYLNISFIVILQIIVALGGVIFLSKLISPSPIAPYLTGYP